MSTAGRASRRRAALVPALVAALTIARMLRLAVDDRAWPWALLLVVSVGATVFLLWPSARTYRRVRPPSKGPTQVFPRIDPKVFPANSANLVP